MQAKLHGFKLRFITLVRAAIKYLPYHDRKTLDTISLEPLVSMGWITNRDSALNKKDKKEGIQKSDTPRHGTAREVRANVFMWKRCIWMYRIDVLTMEPCCCESL